MPTKVPRKRLEIDTVSFMELFAADDEYRVESYPVSYYLDLRNGELLWVFEEDEDASNVAFHEGWTENAVKDNKKHRRLVKSNPKRFMPLTGFEHGTHHELLREFLATNWTENANLKLEVEAAYYKVRSIGRWKATVGEVPFREFETFRESHFKKLATTKLRRKGIEPVWK